MIAIIDYGMGNLRSVQKALEKLGHAAEITASPREIAAAERVILPGVGAFGAAMANLQRPTEEGPSLAEAVLQAIGSGRPFLGICLGMQLLLSASDELGHFAGLDVIPGQVTKFDFNGRTTAFGGTSGGDGRPPGPPPGSSPRVPPAQELKVPHMGWNALCPQQPAPLLRGVEPGSMVYFVHSYYCAPRDPACVAATTTHGIPFCSVIWRDNVAATQFHPEKSGEVGLRLLNNFACA